MHVLDMPARTRRIFSMRDAVLTQWEHEVRAKVRGADALLTPILINTLPAFFDNLAEALTPGYPRDNATSNTNAPAVHGNERARMSSYGPEQVIQEYQIFRDCFADAALDAGVPLRRALENLVGNALKYGDDGPIHIHVNTLRERMMLTVHNTGSTIAPEQTERIFEYLRREHQGSATGWGIGLPFVQNVAESHGGSALVDSAPETGSTFTIDLPIDCRPFVTPDA